MTDFWLVLLLSLLPGAGNFAGGVIAEFWKPSPRLLNWALHAASGILIAIVAVELIPNALDVLAGWWLAAAFAAGGLTYIALHAGVERVQTGRRGRTGMWMIYIAVAIDLASDGLVLGAGSAVSLSLALVLASGQILADVPEGYASIASFRSNDVPRAKRLWLSASFVTFCTAGATLAYFGLRGAPEPFQMAALVFVAGLLTLAAVEDMLEEAHESNEDSKRSMLAFLVGFVLFTLVSVGLETVVAGSDSAPSNHPDSQTR
jgi:ZIP family zinc transporter